MKNTSPEHVKLAIIGSGPAGYTAGIYAGRATLAPILFAGTKSGGQLMNTTDIENFPGFPQGKNGPALMFDMRAQAERFGTIIRDEYVTAIDFSERPFRVWSFLPEDVRADAFERMSGEEAQVLRKRIQEQPPALVADAIILSVGARSRMLGIPGEQVFLGRGVSTCAVCDAAFFREKKTIVVGGGDTACEDTLALTKFAAEVHMIVRGGELRASKVMQERVKNHEKVQIHYFTALEEITGGPLVKSVRIKDTRNEPVPSGQPKYQDTFEMPIDGVFVAIGHLPMTQVVQGQVELDSHSFIVTRMSPTKVGLAMAQKAREELVRAGQNESTAVPYPSMTSVEGVFAAGDCVDPRYWQAVTAAAQGCMAAIDAERWLEGR